MTDKTVGIALEFPPIRRTGRLMIPSWYARYWIRYMIIVSTIIHNNGRYAKISNHIQDLVNKKTIVDTVDDINDLQDIYIPNLSNNQTP